MKNWYMLNIRHNSEKKVCALLRKKKVETYCPLIQKQVKNLGRLKTIYDSLFASCIFALLSEDDLKLIPQLKNIATIAFWQNNYAIIPEEEIETIKEFVLQNQNIKLEKSKVGIGKIIITNSPNYSNNSNSVSIMAGLYKVQLPSIGFTMIAEAQRESEREFENDHSIFSRSIRSILQT